MAQRPWVFYGWIVVACTVLVTALTSGARMSFGVALIPISEQFGWTRTTLSTIVLMSGIVSGVLQMVVGVLVDRIGPKRLMASGVILLGLGVWLLTFATTVWQFGLAYLVLVLVGVWQTPLLLYVAVICMGLSWTSTVTLLATTCSDLYGRGSQGSVFGMVFGVMSWSVTLGVWFPGLLYDTTGSYSSALWVNVLVAWVASGVVLWLSEWWGSATACVESSCITENQLRGNGLRPQRPLKCLNLHRS